MTTKIWECYWIKQYATLGIIFRYNLVKDFLEVHLELWLLREDTWKYAKHNQYLCFIVYTRAGHTDIFQ